MIAKNGLILFVVLLVISITPISAIKIRDATNYNNTDQTISDLEKKANDLELLQNELKNHTTNIEDSMNFVKNNFWKFWKWRQVKDQLNQILKESRELNSLTDQLTDNVKDIESDSNKLNESINNSKSNASCSDDEFYREVEKRANTTLDISGPTNFKQGDIVEYTSKKGNHKYLEFIKIDNLTSYVILKTSENKNIALSQEFFNKTASHKISPKTSNSQLINIIDDQQQENIQSLKTQAEKRMERGVGSEYASALIMCSAVAILGVSLILFVIAMFCITLTEFTAGLIDIIAAILTKIGLILFVEGMILLISGGILLFWAKYEMKQAVKDSNNVNLLNKDLNDLMNSLNSFPFAGDLNITTNATASVNDTLNGTDFDDNNLTYIIVEQPKQGTLETSLNGSFVYTPNSNCTGQDSFKYKVNDGKVDSNIATVNITVLSTSTKIIINNIKGKLGSWVNLTARLFDCTGKPIKNQTITFEVNNTMVGQAQTNENGTAILKNYLLKNIGKYVLKAIFTGNNQYTASNGTSYINILSKKLPRSLTSLLDGTNIQEI